jgi:hypothetical protein
MYASELDLMTLPVAFPRILLLPSVVPTPEFIRLPELARGIMETTSSVGAGQEGQV